MNEGRLSNELLEAASQGDSSALVSVTVTDVFTQSAVESQSQMSVMITESVSQLSSPSPVHFSSLVFEVMRQVPVMRANLTPTMN